MLHIIVVFWGGLLFPPPFPLVVSLGVLHEWPKPSSLAQKRRFDEGKDYFWARTRLGPLRSLPPVVLVLPMSLLRFGKALIHSGESDVWSPEGRSVGVNRGLVTPGVVYLWR